MASLTSDVLDTSPEANNSIPSGSSFLQRRKSSSASFHKKLSSPNIIIDEESMLPDSDQNIINTTNKLADIRFSRKREVYRFQADWLVSSVAWSNEPGEAFRLALGSYMEDYRNRIQLVSLFKDEYNEEIVSLTSFDHPYPATKLSWIPRANNGSQLPAMLATTADYLRLWRVEEQASPNESAGVTLSTNHDKNPGNSALVCDDGPSNNNETTAVEVKLECLLNTNKGLKYCAPLTSFDWNDIDPSIIVTSSVDTTCAVWDIESAKVLDSVSGSNRVNCNLRSQIVAHNHEVYDVSFSRSGTGREVFMSAGGDGSIRMFDLRRLTTSTMLYETERTNLSANGGGPTRALVRVCCNKQDANYVIAFATNSKDIIIIDVRQPGRPVVVLNNHTADLNSMSWAPHSAHHICSASNDRQALIWELSKLPNHIEEPLLAYRANGKINAISWSTSHSDWIAIGFENYLELLRV